MHSLVRFTADDDGYLVESDSWHLVDPTNPGGSPQKFCSGEVFGFGEGAAVFKTREVMAGGITCLDCLKKLKAYRAVKI